MKKLNIGLPVSIFAALIYFGAIINPLIPIALIAYAILAEDRAALKATITQAMVVLGISWGITGIYTVINELVSLLNNFVADGYLHMPYALNSLLVLLPDVVLLIFGVLALLGAHAVLGGAGNQPAGFAAPGVNAPAQPVQPAQPVHPVQPIQPVHPVHPVQPVHPAPQDPAHKTEGAPKQ